MKHKILIVAGGTGGHISPAIALYEEFQKDGISCIFVSLEKNKNYSEFQKKNIPVKYVVSPKLSLNIKESFLFFPLLLYGVLQSCFILINNKIQVIISLGGYPTITMLIAGILLRKKIYLCEQNVVPGRVTKLFYPFADKVFLTFPIEDNLSKDKRFVVVGFPFRKELFEFASRLKKKKKTIKTIFIAGGSQGALQLNHMILNLWRKYPEYAKQYQWIVQTGEKHLSEMKKNIENLSFKDQITCFGFSTNIYEYFAKADLLICRAGSGIVNEAILFKLPTITIPYPYAKDNHQLKNAEFIQKNNFGILLNTKSSDPELLLEVLQKITKECSLYFNTLQKNRIEVNPSEIIKKEII